MNTMNSSFALIAATLTALGPISELAAQESGDLYVANLSGNNVTVFDRATGKAVGDFVRAGEGGLSAPTGLAFGPDGSLYVSSSGSAQILRFGGPSGRFAGVFVAHEGLAKPFALIFGPDGNLFVSDGENHTVQSFSGATGEFLGVVASHPSLKAPIGLAFGPNGLLYVANAGGNSVEVFDVDTRANVRSIEAPELQSPSDIAFGPDGLLYVSSAFSSRVLALNVSSGTLDRVVATLPEGGVPMGLAFGENGALFVGDFARNRLYRIDSRGELTLVAENGLASPENITIRPSPSGRRQ